MRVVNSHALYQVLIVPLRPCLTLHAVIHLLFESVVVSGQHLDAVLVALIMQPELINQLLLCPSHSFLLSDVIRKLFVLRLHPLQVLSLIPRPLELLGQVFQLNRQLGPRLLEILLQSVNFLTVCIPLSLIKLLELLNIFSRVIILLGFGRGGERNP